MRWQPDLHYPLHGVMSKVGYVVQVAGLWEGIFVCYRTKGKGKGFMVSQNVKLTAFHQVAKMLDGEVYRKEFAIECAISGFCRLKCLAIGYHALSICCLKMVPTALSDASAMMQIGACGFRWASRVALARASLIATKAVVAVSSQARCRVLSSNLSLFSGSKLRCCLVQINDKS